LKGVGADLGEIKSAVEDIFNNPIKGFGVLGGYARRRVREAAGVNTDRILHPLSPQLAKLAKVYEKYVSELSRTASALLRRYGKGIADQQHAQKRVADLAIDLFVGMCTNSRADWLVTESHPDAAQPVLIAETFTRQARRRMSRNVRGLDHNDDKAIERLAGAVLERGSYPFDVI
jgi:alkylation response protein AidB-like acyl-CoA dehydrogenase